MWKTYSWNGNMLYAKLNVNVSGGNSFLYLWLECWSRLILALAWPKSNLRDAQLTCPWITDHHSKGKYPTIWCDVLGGIDLAHNIYRTRKTTKDKTDAERSARQKPCAISSPETKYRNFIGYCDLPCERTHHGKGRGTTTKNPHILSFSLWQYN